MRKLMWAAVAFWLVMAGALHAGEPTATMPATESTTAPALLSVVGLSVNHDVEEGSPHGMNPGTSLTLRVELPGSSIVLFDREASRCEALMDDKGTDLLAARRRAPRADAWPAMAGGEAAPSRKAYFVPLAISQCPAAGATRLHLKGELALKVGGEVKTAEQKGVHLDVGTVITTGPIPLSIARIVRQRPDDPNPLIVIHSDQFFDAIKKIEFFTADGTLIPAYMTAQARQAKGNQPVECHQDWSLKSPPADVTVRVTYFETLETVTVPVDLEFGVGM